MYDADYRNRMNIQQICTFFNVGAETFDIKEGTPKERHMKYSRAFSAGMHSFRDRVLAFDWDTVSEVMRGIKTEDMFMEALEASGDLSELAYEMGFHAGLTIGCQLFAGIE